MSDPTELIERYLAVWNESDADARRNRIRTLWAADGITSYRLLVARGHEAIEARVTGAWEKWVRGGNYVFRPKAYDSHHDAVRFDWVMVAVPGGAVEAAGRSFLILNADGRIAADYQFNPSLDDAKDIAERYVAAFNEPSAAVRHAKIASLWAPAGAFISSSAVRNGRDAIAAQASALHDTYVANGFVFAAASTSQMHHDVASFQWQRQSRDGGRIAAAGCELLILDEDGRIRCDYRFDEPLTDGRHA